MASLQLSLMLVNQYTTLQELKTQPSQITRSFFIGQLNAIVNVPLHMIYLHWPSFRP